MIQLQDFSLENLASLHNQEKYPVCIDCGLMSYQDALALQIKTHGRVVQGFLPSVILLLEHPPVITLGMHKIHNQLLCSPSQLSTLGIEVVQVRRGGGSTAHNPGQLVIYPIMHFDTYGFHIAPFVHYLEQIAIHVLSVTNVQASRRKRYPGLWIEGRKIASLGIQIIRNVSMHGIAINLDNDLEIFNYIVPCGIEGVTMTNALREGGRSIPMHELKEVVQSRCISLLPEFCDTYKEKR